MNVNKKLRLIEWTLFAALLVSITGAGFFYELYKEQIDEIFLVVLILVYVLICYAFYSFSLHALIKRVKH